MINMEKDKTIELIAGRIIDEYRKHPELNWSLIAAQKIYSQWNEYYSQQTKAFTDEIDKLQSRISELENGNEWISVEDRLPFNKIPHVLIIQKGLDHPTRGYYSNEKWIVFYHGGAELCEDERPVTHWMPLPNKPKTN